ncbi:unnamed protein product [Blepharisma stoltei]|uniref:C2HC/C3H-type domain-containing protein n=1 Tax=Blepharisma stoltei TaxID=1481888 RepID=A0AAU9JPB6_9CILI|nr:unnamed protein product [Blepharisma stoltei]
MYLNPYAAPLTSSLSLAPTPSYSTSNLDEYKNIAILDNSNFSPVSDVGSTKLRATTNDFFFEDSRVKCQSCNRRFFPDRIEKHQQACLQMQKNRPKFQILDKIFPQIERKDEKPYKNKRSPLRHYQNKHWYKQHQDFINKIRLPEIGTILEENGRDSANYSPTSLEDDYIQCPYCGRRFASLPAERHIPKCKDIINKPKPLRVVLKDKITLPNIYLAYNRNGENESGSLSNTNRISIFNITKSRKISPEPENLKSNLIKLNMEEKIKDSVKKRYTVKHVLCAQCNSFLLASANYCSMCGTKQSFKIS